MIELKRAYTLLEAAISCGSPTVGSERAYDALLARDLPGRLGGCPCRPMEKAVPCDDYPPNLRHLGTVMVVSRALRASVLEELERGRFPVVIGGDHSVAMGSLAALGEYYGAENVALVYIDGHADINTDRTSASGYIHGMDLAAACGLCCEELTVGRQRVNLLGENIHTVAARSIDPPEHGILREQGVHLYSVEGIRKHGVSWALERMLPALKGKKVHVSFDVDALDPTEFSATGYNLPDGLTVEQAEELMARVLAEAEVVSFECVEYNPLLDPDGSDGDKLADLLCRLLK